MTMPLTLPRLSADVPSTLVSPTMRRENARLAKYLLQAGMLRATDVPRRWHDPLTICRRALELWGRRHTNPLHSIEPKLWIEPLPESPISISMPRRDTANSTHSTLCYEKLHLAWCYEACQWPVGEGLEGLDRLMPGLGATALNIITSRSDWIAPLFTPVVAEYWAQYLYWYGEDNEEAALEDNCGDDEEAKAGMRADMVTRAKLDAAFPEWALSPWKHRLKATALKAIDTTGWPGSAAKVVADLIQLDHLGMENRYRPDADGEFIGFAAVLSWREDDVVVRIFDDGVNMAVQSDCCEIAGEFEAPLDAPELLATCLKDMRRGMRVMALVDGLIWRLAHPDWLNTTEGSAYDASHAV